MELHGNSMKQSVSRLESCHRVKTKLKPMGMQRV